MSRAANPYDCWNKPRPIAGAVTHLAQAGYDMDVHEGWQAFSRKPVWIEIRHVMSTDCRYISDKPDPRCAGCQHINQGNV